jgi:hypothetical protein
MSRKNDIVSDERAAFQKQHDVARTRQMKRDMKSLIETPEGRRFLSRLIFDGEGCGLMGAGWSPSAEVHVLAGKRMIGESLLAYAEEVSPHMTRKMTSEWFEDRQEWKYAMERASKGEQPVTTGEDDDA